LETSFLPLFPLPTGERDRVRRSFLFLKTPRKKFGSKKSFLLPFRKEERQRTDEDYLVLRLAEGEA